MRKRVLIVSLLLIIAALALPVSNLILGAPQVKLDGVGIDPGLAKIVPVIEKKCTNCHSTAGRMPFYGKLPVVRGIIEKDIRRGTRFLDLAEELGQAAVLETVLAKMERTTERGEMPPFRYRALHWDSSLGDAEREDIIAWARQTRRARYATADAPDGIKGDVLQPLPLQVSVDEKKARLGEKLYHDKRLSGDNTVSCASCHDLAKGGTDQLPVSVGIRGQKGPINSPTVFNAGFQIRQFWDGRAADLQEQAAGPVENPLEMGEKWDNVVAKLRSDPDFVATFTALYPEGVSKTTITHAIAEFERGLITPGSRFDRYLRGDQAALSAEEKRGHQLFVDRGCTVCHVGKLLGGASFELMGEQRDYFAERGNITEADNGRFNFTKKERDRHRFKVPTLRNVALTFPYFHDAFQKTLDAAM